MDELGKSGDLRRKNTLVGSVNIYNEDYGKYADKYEVRKYIAACGLEEHLVR